MGHIVKPLDDSDRQLWVHDVISFAGKSQSPERYDRCTFEFEIGRTRRDADGARQIGPIVLQLLEHSSRVTSAQIVFHGEYPAVVLRASHHIPKNNIAFGV